ncbi:MAG TPA: hypothetical protein VHY84_10665 [Bryobacteraceae bacterium]|jgi:hypothetical protein|nr:hypothetical protein [Bryobacteraceae bacterium]
MTPQDTMGVLNKKWGICGFTSSLYALYTNSPGQRLRLSQGASVTSRMLAEIKTYLVILQAAGRFDLLGSIEVFTQSFGGIFTDFTVPGYIARINNIVTLSDEGLENLADEKIFGIAMPPDAVVDYLQRICELRAARTVTTDMPELILGLCSKDKVMYNGLAHYVYRLNGTVYSWGKQFPSVEATAVSQRKDWTIGHRIAIT